MRREISQGLFKRGLKVIPGGVNSPVRAFRNVDGEPFYVKRAKGARIEDVDGNHMIDYVGTWGPAILGHAPGAVVSAVQQAARDGLSFGIPNRYEVEMADLIVDWVPSVEKVRMTNSGTEATMSAIRLARGATGRKLIVKFEGCYHGHVDSLLVAAGSGALTFGRPDSAGVPEELAALTITLPYNDPQALREVFAERGEQIAAVIIEPFPANAGLILPQSGYLELVRELTEKAGSVLIFDEVMTGFRLARGGVQELTGVTPDLTAMGKVIGGGLPVGAFGGNASLMDELSPDGPVYQAGTLSGNPLAMVAGLTQLHELERHHAFSRLDEIGLQFETGVRHLLSKHGLNYTFHRVGSMFCLFFTEHQVNNLNDVKGANLEHFKRFFHQCLDNGLYLAPSPYETGFISLSHSESDIEESLEIMDMAMGA